MYFEPSCTTCGSVDAIPGHILHPTFHGLYCLGCGEFALTCGPVKAWFLCDLILPVWAFFGNPSVVTRDE